MTGIMIDFWKFQDKNVRNPSLKVNWDAVFDKLACDAMSKPYLYTPRPLEQSFERLLLEFGWWIVEPAGLPEAIADVKKSDKLYIAQTNSSWNYWLCEYTGTIINLVEPYPSFLKGTTIESHDSTRFPGLYIPRRKRVPALVC